MSERRLCPVCERRFGGVTHCPDDGVPLEPLPTVDPLLGRTLDGRFQIIERIGAGGMGVVYRATQLSIGREVAVKVLAGEIGADGERARRFRREARIISQLRHPNTVELYDYGAADGHRYLVTELLRGRTLREALDAGPFPHVRAATIIDEVCAALAEAHGAGVVHRDLKPANIFLERAGGEERVKILDYGVARTADGTQTQPGRVVGTPEYMAPEQAQGRAVDASADIYALGVILYEMLAGRPPFEGGEPISVLYAHVHDTPPLFSDFEPPVEAPRGLEALAFRMLAKEPARRPGTVREVRKALRSEQSEAERPPARPSTLRWALPIAVGAALGATALWLWGARPPTPSLAPPVLTERAPPIPDAAPPPPDMNPDAGPPVDAAVLHGIVTDVERGYKGER